MSFLKGRCLAVILGRLGEELDVLGDFPASLIV